MSRIDNLKDIFDRFVLTSDPYICHLQNYKQKIIKLDVPVDVLNMLIDCEAIEISENEPEGEI